MKHDWQLMLFDADFMSSAPRILLPASMTVEWEYINSCKLKWVTDPYKPEHEIWFNKLCLVNKLGLICNQTICEERYYAHLIDQVRITYSLESDRGVTETTRYLQGGLHCPVKME